MRNFGEIGIECRFARFDVVLVGFFEGFDAIDVRIERLHRRSLSRRRECLVVGLAEQGIGLWACLSRRRRRRLVVGRRRRR